MAEAMLWVRRRKARERMAVAGTRYAARGWPVCQGAHPPRGAAAGGGAPRACSCDRIGCPAPAAHPVSPAWQSQATTDPATVLRWWIEVPRANVILATGRAFDVLDVPSAAGRLALSWMAKSDLQPGPVAVSGHDRALFFVASRNGQLAEDEQWSCRLDGGPDVAPNAAGLRWHSRDSYVLAPPSRLGNGTTARWIRDPAGSYLPDPLGLLGLLADACETLPR